MSIWNKILIWLIALALLPFFYMSARTLKTHQYWRVLARQYEDKIKQVQDDNMRLVEGVQKDGEQTELGIRQARIELHKFLIDRGRIWDNWDAKIKVGREKGDAEIRLTTDQENPHGIAKESVVYAFEKSDVQEKGRYLGEFKVAAEADKQLTLVPTARLTPREIERLSAAKKTWTIYEVMPRDRHHVFAGLSEADQKVMLPAATLPQYLKDGKPAAKDDPEENVVDGKYVRPLRDYQVLFRADRVNYTEMVDLFEATTRDKEFADAALAEGKLQEEAAKRYVAEAKVELAKFARERDAVAALFNTLNGKVAAMKKIVDEKIETAKAMAGQLARLQWEAVQRIDRRSRAMAQSSGTGSK